MSKAHLVREDIDFSKSLLSTVGKSFTKEQWESLESDTKDREIALAMNKIGREYITKSGSIQSYNKNIDYKLIREVILSKSSIVLSTFVDPVYPELTLIIEYNTRPNSKKETKKIKILNRNIDELMVLVKEKIKGLLLGKYDYILYYNGLLLTDDILKSVTDLSILVHLNMFEKSSKEFISNTKTIDYKNENIALSMINDLSKVTFPKYNSTESIPIPKFNNTIHVTIMNGIYLIYWGVYLLSLPPNKKINEYQLLDCIISLKKCLNAFISLELFKEDDNIILDINIIADQLSHKYIQYGYVDMLSSLANNFPCLISNSTFSISNKTYGIELYPEQTQVLDIVYNKLSDNSPMLLGYKVPPSGGKTILSIALGEMIHTYFPRKKLLYICYNTLVRLSVANACKLANMPFWVLSSGHDIDIQYIGRINGKQTHMPKFDGSMINKYKHYLSCGSFHPPRIIIADILSAKDLLVEFPNDFIVYLDEPTAGAENGIGDIEMGAENTIQKLNAEIIYLSRNSQLVLLSSTLPNFEHLSGLHNMFADEDMYYVKSNKIPVGCMAIHPDGYEILPHELLESNNVIDFRNLLSELVSSDSKNIKYYTFDKVKQIANNIEAAGFLLPHELIFQNYFNDISKLSNLLIQEYVIELFTYLLSLSDANLIEYKAIINTINPHQRYNLNDFIKEGKCLSVSIRDKFISPDEKIGLSKHIEDVFIECNINIPPLEPILREFEIKKNKYNKMLESSSKSSNCKKDDIEEELEPVEFIWEYKVGNSCALVTDKELKLLPYDISAMILSGIGIYDPMSECSSELEKSVAMREAINGRLSILFASPDITYGTNMALISIFIDKYYGHQATHNSLYQLIGRAGRVGKSYKARVLFESIEVMKKALLEMDDNFEAMVMNYYLCKFK